MVAASELTYDINATAVQMAETIFGDGVQVVDATYTGDTYTGDTCTLEPHKGFDGKRPRGKA